jgi:hypothetical protein
MIEKGLFGKLFKNKVNNYPFLFKLTITNKSSIYRSYHTLPSQINLPVAK